MLFLFSVLCFVLFCFLLNKGNSFQQTERRPVSPIIEYSSLNAYSWHLQSASKMTSKTIEFFFLSALLLKFPLDKWQPVLYLSEMK